MSVGGRNIIEQSGETKLKKNYILKLKNLRKREIEEILFVREI